MDDVIEPTATVDELRATIDAQQAEIDALRAQLANGGPSRRQLLKGAGVVAGGLAALGAAGAAGAAGSVATASPAAAAVPGPSNAYRGGESISLRLRIDGVDVPGDPSLTNRGPQGSIECFYYQHDVALPVSAAGAIGRRTYQPIVIRKRVDRVTPLLYKALTLNELIDAEFWFFGERVLGSGVSGVEHVFTVGITNGRVVRINAYSPDNKTIYAGGRTVTPTLEEVSFVFDTITWTAVDGGIEHTDSWTGS